MIVMNYEQKINDVLKNAAAIEIYKNGVKTKLTKRHEIEPYLNKILSAFEGARIMPAFGVSLDAETKAAMQQGDWVELKFNQTETINEMPFNSLCFRLESCYGLNLIRGLNGNYNGRCIYLDLPQQTNLTQILN